MNGYKTAEETAKKWGITTRRVQIMCSNGQVPGAVKFGHAWAIPSSVKKPQDGRITTGEYINSRAIKKGKAEEN